MSAIAEDRVAQEILRTLDLLHPGRMVEIRALGVPSKAGRRVTASGYFLDHALAAQEASQLDADGAAGIYVILNEIHAGAYARAPERIVFAPEHTTVDKDILRRRWILIDADPIRPSGVSSTDAELEAAHEVICQIRNNFIESFSDSMMLLAMSGNGYHLLVEESLEQGELSALLIDLQHWYTDGSGVQIDQQVVRMAQLTKLYGTRARKGFAITGRPHRQSRIVEVWHHGECDSLDSFSAAVASCRLSEKPRLHDHPH